MANTLGDYIKNQQRKYVDDISVEYLQQVIEIQRQAIERAISHMDPRMGENTAEELWLAFLALRGVAHRIEHLRQADR